MNKERFSFSLLGALFGTVVAGALIGFQIFSRAPGEFGWPYNIYDWGGRRLQPRYLVLDIIICLFLTVAAMAIGTKLFQRQSGDGLASTPSDEEKF